MKNQPAKNAPSIKRIVEFNKIWVGTVDVAFCIRAKYTKSKSQKKTKGVVNIIFSLVTLKAFMKYLITIASYLFL